MKGVCEPRYTTRRRNAHGIAEYELLYPWHPWAGCLVHIHEVVEKAGAAPKRATVGLSDTPRSAKRSGAAVCKRLDRALPPSITFRAIRAPACSYCTA